MPSLRHLHIYERARIKPLSKELYRCIHPDCTHYAKRNMILGKRAMCAVCLNESGFILTGRQLRNRTPKCPMCAGDVKSKSIQKLATLPMVASVLENLNELPEIEKIEIVPNGAPVDYGKRELITKLRSQGLSAIEIEKRIKQMNEDEGTL